MADRFANFLVERVLGAGSFATVWLARDPRLDTYVAIKVLADNWARNDDVRNRFIEEARMLRQISHDGVVRVFLIDDLDDGRPYFAMEWADRGSLYDRMTGTPWKPAEAVHACLEVLDCLVAVHDFGVVHRDVKPSNVLYRSLRTHERAADRRSGRAPRDDRPVMGDFGLAKNVVAASGFTFAAGTPAYMAPEQARATSTTGPTADLFSVGVVLFELLTGHALFNAETLSEIRAGSHADAAPTLRQERPDLSVALVGEVERALQSNPVDRHSSAFDMAVALRASLEFPIVGPAARDPGQGTVLRTNPATPPPGLVGSGADDGPPELELLRSGKVRLPATLDAEARRLLSSGSTAGRLGFADSTDRIALHDAANAALERWTTQVNTGRLPFSARSLGDAVVAAAEELWLATRPD